MPRKLNRRQFNQTAVAAVAAPFVLTEKTRADSEKSVRVGFVGVGGRGSGLLGASLRIAGVQVPAVCDIDVGHANNAANMVERAGGKRPETYTKGETDFKRMMDRDDLDAVMIATPWNWHTPMAVYAMKRGLYAGVEVPCALTLDECWQLVRTHEQTHAACMMMENWSFRRDNLAVLNMIRAGLLGRTVHCHCAHSHNCDYWYVGKKWPLEFLKTRCADQYPTHSLGPVLSWMDINCGDRFETIVSMATNEWGLTDQLVRKYGKDSPLARQAYKQGDVVTSIVRTANGKTVVINNDMQLPRPYDNRWLIQGTRGLYNEQRDSVYLADGVVGRNSERWSPFQPYQEKYNHAWWRGGKETQNAVSSGHGGVDGLELYLFYEAVRNRTQTPIDVYDSVVMSAVVPLSEASIAKGSQPVEFPDFTGGKWKATKPKFAIDEKFTQQA